MKKLLSALALYAFALLLSVSQSGCGGAKEVPPPESAPTMTEEEQKNYENQMDKMKEYRKNTGKN